MKKINLETMHGFWPMGMVWFIFSVVVFAYSWFQVSPWTLKLFTRICDSNGGVGCMVYYWKQASFYWTMFRIFSALSVFLGLGTVCLIFWNGNKKDKKRNN